MNKRIIATTQMGLISFFMFADQNLMGPNLSSIANDFGRALNSGAYLSKLCRTKIGRYNLKDAFSLNDVEEKIKLL